MVGGGGTVIEASKMFKDVLPFSHTALTRVLVLQPTQSHSYEQTDTLEVASGTLTVDGKRNIRRQANLVLAPSFGSDLGGLMEINDASRLQLQRGVQFIDGSIEWVTVATLGVQSADRTLGEGVLKVSAFDPSSAIDDYRLITPYAPIGTDQKPLTTVAAIKDLVDIALWEEPVWHVGPGVDTAVRPPEGTVFQGSRWDAINKLATGLGAQVSVDAVGEWHIDKIDAGPYEAVAFLSTGPGGVLVSGTYARNRRDLYNAVPLRWEGPTGGGLVFIVDEDQDSPTFWNGPFGRRPASEQRVETVTTQQAAVDAARGLLAQFKGFAATVKFDSVYNPLLEPNDPVEVLVVGELHQIHVIDSLSFRLDGGGMTVESRAVQNLYTQNVEVAA